MEHKNSKKWSFIEVCPTVPKLPINLENDYKLKQIDAKSKLKVAPSHHSRLVTPVSETKRIKEKFNSLHQLHVR